jgi:hypothetical protein
MLSDYPANTEIMQAKGFVYRYIQHCVLLVILMGAALAIAFIESEELTAFCTTLVKDK